MENEIDLKQGLKLQVLLQEGKAAQLPPFDRSVTHLSSVLWVCPRRFSRFEIGAQLPHRWRLKLHESGRWR